MSVALLTCSHSPLLEHADLEPRVASELDTEFAHARQFVQDYDPDLVVNFGPDHYNGFFYTRLLTSNLSTDILDRIDQIVAPGSTIADDGNTYLTDALTNPFLRRRRTP